MKMRLLMAGTAVAATFMIAAHAQGNIAAGKKKAVACAACHGADGNSQSPQFPKLAGQNANYLIKQLKDFKSGARKNPIMSGMAAGLSEQDMEDVAAYFSSQTMTIGSADPKLVSKGRRLYLGGNAGESTPACAACHNPEGQGNPPAAYPRLSGQYAQYIESQLKAFADGNRDNSPKHMMHYVASHLSDDQIQAVASYLEGLHKNSD